MTSTDLHDCFVYVDCDIPAGMTVAEWRREQSRERSANQMRTP